MTSLTDHLRLAEAVVSLTASNDDFRKRLAEAEDRQRNSALKDEEKERLRRAEQEKAAGTLETINQHVNDLVAKLKVKASEGSKMRATSAARDQELKKVIR